MAFRFPPLVAAALALLIAGGGATVALLEFYERSRHENTAPTSIPIGGPFTLMASNGATITERSYWGKWLLVYFGCARCSDARPALDAMSRALQKLGPTAAELQALFITIDPRRDTPKVLTDYMKPFDRKIVGLTGTPVQIASMAKEYRVYYAPRKTTSGGYIIDHSSFIDLVSPRGRLAKFFAGNTSGTLLADELRQILNRSSPGRPVEPASFTPSAP